MTILPSSIAGTFQPWARGIRRLTTGVALVAGLTMAMAQNAVSTLAGSQGVSGYNNATGTAATFSFTNPSGVVVDASGNVYVADALNNAIRMITSAGVVTTYAGSATGVAGANNATGTSATFSSPQGLAIDGAGNIYVADTGNNLVRMIASGGVVTTLAGTAGSSGHLDGTGTAAKFNQPLGIACDRAGGGGAAVNVYVADGQTNAISQIVVSTKVVTTLAGPLAPAITNGDADGTTVAATSNSAFFNSPRGIVSDTAGTTLYVADSGNNKIRKIVITSGPTTATVSTIAGPAAGTTTSGYTEGTSTAARFNLPTGIAFSPGSATALLVTDTLNQVIRSVPTSGAATTSLYAGTPNTGTPFSNGLATGGTPNATFSIPTGVTSNSTTAYIVDTNNKVVRTIAAATAPAIGGGGQPSNQSVAAGATATFTVTNVTANPPASYQWQRSADSGGTWNSLTNGAITGGTISGATTATLSISSTTSALNSNQFRVVISNGLTNATSSAVTLTITQPPVITNSSTNLVVTVNAASTAAITASGSPAPTFAVTTGTFPSAWASLSTFQSTGQIVGTPTDTVGSPFSFSVAATNTGGTSSAVAFTLTVVTGPSIGTQPGNQSVSPGIAAQFSVSANANGGTLSYQWQVSTDSGGTWNNISTSDGAYSGVQGTTLTVSSPSLAMSGYQYRIVITSTAGSPSVITSNAASLTVLQAPSFTSGSSTTFVTGQSNSFSVTANGSPAPTFSVVSGSLPSSVTLTNFGSGTATISGSPVTSDATGSPYTVTLQATSTAGTVTQTFTLNVSTAPASPAITTQPTNQTAQVAANATFTAAATGNPAPTLQWQRQPAGTTGFVSLGDDSTYSGTTSGTLTITNVQAGMTGDQFQLVATNTNGSVTSSVVTLTINIGTSFTTLAGTATQFGTADGTGVAARFNAPTAIVYDASSGNFYVADSANHVIRKVNSAGSVTTFAGTAGSSGNADGTGSAARFSGPSAVAVDSAGNVYVADTFNHTIRAITPGGAVTTLAGLAGNSGFIDGTGTSARFAFPSGVVADNTGNLYVADTSNHNIRKVMSGGVVVTLAGGYVGSLSTGAVGITGSANGNGASARFNYPAGLARDNNGNIYVADSYNHAIRKIDTSANVTTLAGSLGSAGSTDANGTNAKFNQPMGVAVDSSGIVYVADTYNDTIRAIDTSANVTTLAGAVGQTGSADGIGSAARFNQPFGIAVDGSANLYIADTRNFTIRRSGTTTAPGIATQPSDKGGVAGGSVTFTIVATGVPAPSYQWQRQAAGSSGFVNLVNDIVNFSGVTTGSLTVSNLSSLNNGDQYRVILTNGITPAATSNAATLALVAAPTFTSAASATFNVGQVNSFPITTTSSTSTTYSAAGLPSWLSLDASTGVLSGTPPDTSGSPLSFAVTANNGGVATQTFTLTLVLPVVAPTITTQPAGTTVNRGASASFSIVASGTAPLSYQWNRNGIALTGATGSTLTISNIEPANAGNYTVTVLNSVNNVTSAPATLVVNTAPIITTQPRAQTVIAGTSASFSVAVNASPTPTYQWRLNGVSIAGANSPTFSLAVTQTANAGNYDVVVANAYGQVVSSIAQLAISSTNTVPLITSQPASRTVLVGTSTTLAIAAAGVPTPSYQWRKNGSPIVGATGTSYAIGNVQVGDAGTYDVVVSNSAGNVTSSPAAVTIIRHSYAGVYFGSFGPGFGSYAIYLRPDNTGVFLGYLPGSQVAVKNLSFGANDAGQFSFSQATTFNLGFNGAIGTDGTITGTLSGIAGASLSGSKSADVGATQALAGFYQAAAANTSTSLYVIASATGQSYVLTQSSAVSDGALGSIDATGHFATVSTLQVVSGNIVPDTSTLSATSIAGTVTTTYSGASESVLAAQRLANISTRANVGTGTNVAIAGFVISGTESKTVLIRAIGPTLGTAFSVPGSLSNPKLELYNNANVVIATNIGWASATNTAAIVAASTQAGAFALGATSADSVILTTLAPGNYSAVVSSATGGSGIALVEVYDLSAASAGQKLFNISTRANAGSGVNALAAGIVVNGTVPKRVLIRAVGPGLTQLNLTGVLPQPQLQVLNSANQVVATNTGWGTSPDATTIATLSNQVGAFPLLANSADSAMIISLPPGNYTAQINPLGTVTSGIAIIEVYELP